MAAQRVDVDERRAGLVARHHLARTGSSFTQVAGDLVGLHASDPTSVYLAARARVGGLTVGDVEASLYDERSTVRVLGMRRTMFVVPLARAPLLEAACTRAFVDRERSRLVSMLENQGITEGGTGWVDRVSRETLAALELLGDATAAELTEMVPDLGTQLTFGEGKTWGGTVGVSTRILFLLATEGIIVRGRPLGTWLSSQYRWSLMHRWTGRPLVPLEQDDARRDLLDSWLRAFGPGTERDMAWWTGWGIRTIRKILDDIGAVAVSLSPGEGWVARGYEQPHVPASPVVALLPSLDPTPMGWKERDWYVGDNSAELFDRNGNIGATVWVDGRIVGGWSQDESGGVVWEVFDALDSTTTDMLEHEASALTDWFAGVRVTPRFRTPLEKRLASL